jgi:hypothetical protein
VSTPGFGDSPPKPRPAPSVAAAPAGFGNKPPGFASAPPGFGDQPPAGFADKPPVDTKPPPGQSGLFSVNPGVNVIGDYLTKWTKFAGGGIRDEFRTVVDGLSKTFHLGIYDFDKGHHYAPNDPHLDGRAMDVDTIDGDQVGTKLTPSIRSYITAALATPNVRVGVPKEIYAALPANQKARAFVDAPAHIHTELAKVMPGQTVAPAGFKPDPPKGFVKDPQAKFGDKPPASVNATQPQAEDPETGRPYPPTVQETMQMAHSGLNEMAGHQDLPFIMANALQRDNAGPLMQAPGTQRKPGERRTVVELMQDPNSNVRRAWEMYRKDPAQAMDEYGMGSPAQDKFMSENYPGTAAGKTSAFMLREPLVNLLTSFGAEQLNPMSWAEGAIGGKALGVAGDLLHGSAVEGAAQKAASGIGMGSPLTGSWTKVNGKSVWKPGLASLNEPGNPRATQWAKRGIASLSEPERTPKINLPANKEMFEKVFDSFDQATKDEIVRQKTGLKPNPKFADQQADLAARAKILKDDMRAVQKHKERVGILKPENVFDKHNSGDAYFPMGHSYDFGPQAELEDLLKGPEAAPGGVNTQHKAFGNLDEAQASGKLAADHDMANNYDTWRRQSLQRVAFEDWIAAAPPTVRRDAELADFNNKMGVPPQADWQPSFPGMERYGTPDEPDKWGKIQNAFADFNSRMVGEGADPKTTALGKEIGWDPKYGDPRRITPAGTDRWIPAFNLMPRPGMSPALEKSMLAPEAWEFMRSNKGLQSYISTGGSMLPGQEQTPLGHMVAIFRNMILTNFYFHPTVNIAQSDSIARDIFNLGGPQWSHGGYAYNAARALALQAGLNPERFVASAKEYSEWADRALIAGGHAHFGAPRTGALGGDYASVLTSPSKRWFDRANKALTKAGDFNRERTFGDKGELAFATPFFKDAVQRGGMTDAKAGELTRQFMGDYYNFDPKSPWSTFFFFMPWLKTITKAGTIALIRKPQSILGPLHAMRNYGLNVAPEQYQNESPPSDFGIPMGGGRRNLPFVFRDVSHIANAAGSAAKGDILGAAEQGEQMVMGRATPPTRLANDMIVTLTNTFSNPMKGPETDWNMIVTPAAPPDVQLQQATKYFASHFIPMPLFSYAMQDAARKGMSANDIGQALISAGGAGTFQDESLDAFTKRQLSKAQAKYKKAYENYRYKDFGLPYLKSAWDDYSGKLRDLGVTQ